MGEVLIQAKETGEIKRGNPQLSGDRIIRLKDVGVSLNQSSTAQQLARLPDQVFEQRIEDAKAAGKRLTTAKVTVQPEVRAEKVAEIAKGNGPLPNWEYYPVIYADPPWQYEHSKTDN